MMSFEIIKNLFFVTTISKNKMVAFTCIGAPKLMLVQFGQPLTLALFLPHGMRHFRCSTGDILKFGRLLFKCCHFRENSFSLNTLI